MNRHHLSKKAETYLQRLCLDIPHRRVGSEGNRAATEFFAQTVASFDFAVECSEFDCLDWTHGDAKLEAEGESFEAFISPYSLGCRLTAPLAVVSTVDELEMVEAAGKVLLLHGEIAKEQLMPKNFPFFNPEEHKRIIHLLETKSPAAIITATSRNPELAGAMYPFPLIEDGDFDIPSVYVTDKVGERLAEHAGVEISLEIQAERISAWGCNVIARKGADWGRRIVLCAHIDTKEGTPGALDNATGITVLLLLAELLVDYAGDIGIEIVALNGEDDYSAAGQLLYLGENADTLAQVVLGINTDVAGYYQGNTEYSLYGCPDEIATLIRKAFSDQDGIVEGEPWYQSDHSIFVQNQVPAMALTSEQFMELSTHVTHTMRDSPDLVDSSKLVAVALVLRGLLLDLTRMLS
jgi:aminopeptidase YwaD